MRKVKNGECNVRNFRRVFFGMSFDETAFKVYIFASDFEFWIEVNEFYYPLITRQGVN